MYRSNNKDLEVTTQKNQQLAWLLPSATLAEFYLTQRQCLGTTMVIQNAAATTMATLRCHRLAQEPTIKTFYHAKQYSSSTKHQTSDAQETRKKKKQYAPQPLIHNIRVTPSFTKQHKGNSLPKPQARLLTAAEANEKVRKGGQESQQAETFCMLEETCQFPTVEIYFEPDSEASLSTLSVRTDSGKKGRPNRKLCTCVTVLPFF